jgi:hypothetical protein
MNPIIMSENIDYSTFKRFIHKEEAEDLVLFFQEKGIVCRLKDNTTHFDASFSNNPMLNDFHVEVASKDFLRADELLQAEMEKSIHEIESDYYLFSFSDDELLEIVRKRDEWSSFDFVLSKHILKQRGVDLDQAVIQENFENRVEELRLEEKAPQWMLIGGYLAAFSVIFLVFLPEFAIPFALLLGVTMRFRYKTLPTGEKVKFYDASSRKHGAVIIVLAILFSIIALFVAQTVFDQLFS